MNRFLCFVAVLFTFAACQITPSDQIVIEGRVRNVSDSVLITFFYVDGEVGRGVGRDTIVDGRFLFSFTPEKADKQKYSLMCIGEEFPSMTLDFWASAGDRIRVRGNGNMHYMWRVDGPAPEIATSQAMIRAGADLWNEILPLMVQADSRTLSREQRDSLWNVIEQTYHIPITKCEIDWMKSHQTMDAPWLNKLNELAGVSSFVEDYPYREEVIELYNLLNEEQCQLPDAMQTAAALFPVEHVEIGEPLIDGPMKDLEGNDHTLGELKGRYILLDFWSSGCGPCVMAIPEMNEIAEQYADRVAVVSVSIDTDNVWRSSSKHYSSAVHNWSDGLGEAGIYGHYVQGGIPCYTLISPEGIILKQWKGYGKDSLKQEIATLFKE